VIAVIRRTRTPGHPDDSFLSPRESQIIPAKHLSISKGPAEKWQGVRWIAGQQHASFC
jgi:hypothetical protein